METFVRRFIIMSIVYLGVAAVVVIAMLGSEKAMALKFVHSHLNMLGWVSMMIFGVGYHILPKFVGKQMYSKTLGEVQFWAANIGLVAMLVFYTANVYGPSGTMVSLTMAAGVL